MKERGVSHPGLKERVSCDWVSWSDFVGQVRVCEDEQANSDPTLPLQHGGMKMHP